MNSRSVCLTLASVALVVMLAGCATYKVTTPLEQPIDTAASWRMGQIRDALPPDIEAEDKPDEFQYTVLADKIREQIDKKKIFGSVADPTSKKLEISGSIIEYKKGSGFLRFMIGFGAGSAVLTTELQVRNLETGAVLFSGNFKGTVSSWSESGDKCFDTVAKGFAKALEKEQKRLLKGK
jgi:hypothetical protein